MKKAYKTIAAAIVAVFLVAAVVYAGVQDVNFQVSNNTTESLGTVTINLTGGGSDYISVSGSGNFSESIPVNATSLVVNGQTVPSMTTTVVTLPNTHTVRIRWASENIVIIDQYEF